MSVERGTAENILRAFKSCVEEYARLSWEMFSVKIVAIGSDGASVMTGSDKGFYGLMKKEVPEL